MKKWLFSILLFAVWNGLMGQQWSIRLEEERAGWLYDLIHVDEGEHVVGVGAHNTAVSQCNQILLQNFDQVDSTCFEPKKLKYFRKRLVIQNGCRKEVFSGCVEGEILFCKIVENMLVHNKENHCFFDKFCS